MNSTDPSRPVTVSLTVGDAIGRYGFPHGHPFSPSRLDWFWQEAMRSGLATQAQIVEPVQATVKELTRFHLPNYVEKVKQCSDAGEGLLDHGDTPAFPGVYEAASHVAGSAIDAVKRIMRGECRRAMIPIAGLHHARRERAGGFCVFNDAAVAMEALRTEHGLKTMAYVDIDAHHGDGVFYGYEGDPDIIIADCHEDGRFLYPGTGGSEESGTGAAMGSKLNIPMAPQSTDKHFFEIWPRMEQFIHEAKPEFIILQCGTDSIAGDPLTHMQFSIAAHAHAAKRLCHVAESLGHGRVLAVGGGGYLQKNVAEGWCAVLRSLIQAPIQAAI